MSRQNEQKVGFIGLGALGRPMAENLVRAGFDVIVHNRSRNAVDALVALGASPAQSPLEVASAATFIFIMVRDEAQFREVAFSSNGLVEGAKPGQMVIVGSTVGLEAVQQLASSIGEHGADVLDAPVSGGVPAAVEGSLTIMVGGSDSVLSKASGPLNAVAGTIVHTGEVGTGQAAKIANNLVLGINIVGLLEGLKLGIAAGIDPDKLRAIFRSSSSNSWVLERWEQLGPRYKTAMGTVGPNGGSSSILFKDLQLATALARDLSVPLNLGGLTARLCGTGQATGYDDPHT